jgi:TolA-binding protein
LFIFIYFPGFSLIASPLDTLQVEERDTAVIDEFSLAVQLYTDGDYRLAFDQFRHIIENYPASTQGVESRFYLGMVYRRLGQTENARMTLQTFALTFPDHPRAPDAWWNIAEIHTSENRYNDAGMALERLFQFHPEHEIIPKALLEASVNFDRAGDRERSENLLRQLILQHGTSDVIIDARLRFGRYHLDDGRYREASLVFQRTIDDIPQQSVDRETSGKRAEAVYGLARAYHGLGYYDQADREYNRVMESYESYPAYIRAVTARGEMYQQQGNHLGAVDLFRRAQQADGGTEFPEAQAAVRRAMLGIAESYNALGDFSSAATFFDLYARQHAQTATRDELFSIWIGAAHSNEGMGNHRQAADWWNRILSSDPPDALREEAFIRLAMNYYRLRQYDEAAQLLRSCADRFNTDQTAETLFRLGNLYQENLDDPHRALSAYEELVYRFPESDLIDDALYGQARMQLVTENDRNAYRIVQEFRRRFPGSPLLPDVDNLQHELEVFHLQDRDGGFQNITMLMSEMIAGAPRGELAFQLGEIYLNKLKQYPEAARQFETALSMELPREKQTEAEYLYAYSLYRLAQRSSDRASEALAKLGDLNRRAERSTNREAIAWYHLETLARSAGPAETINAAETYISSFPRSGRGAAAHLLLADTYAAVGETENAIERYRLVAQNYRNDPEGAEAAYRLAIHADDAGESDAALGHFSEYIRHHTNGPRIAEATLRAADLHRQAGSHREAGELYEAFIRRFAYHDGVAEAREGLAMSLLGSGRSADALTLFEEIIQRRERSWFEPQPVPNDIVYFAAVAAFRSREHDRAITLFEWYVRLDRSSERTAAASLVLGELYRQRGRTQVADYYFNRSSELFSGGLPDRDIADLLFENGQYERAIPHLLAVASAEESEEQTIAYRRRAVLSLFRSGNAAEAQRRAQLFRDSYPRERDAAAEFEFEGAMLQFRNRSYDAAVRAFQQFIQQHSRHEKIPHAHFYLGRTWEAVGRRSDARKKYEEILEKYAQSDVIPNAHLAYAGLLMRDEQFIEAIDHYRIVMETASDDDDLMYYAKPNLAQAYEEIGFFEASLELIEGFMRRFPNDETIASKRVRIGTLYQHARLHERSVEIFQSLILYADRPLETELRYYTGDSFHMMGQYRRAIREFRTVTEIDPRATQLDWTATALYMAGQSYEQMGDSQGAIAMYQEIIDRRGIEGQYKAAARREIERVRATMSQSN